MFKIIRCLIAFLLFCTVPVLVSNGQSKKKKQQTTNYAYLYSPELTPLHPKYSTFNFNKDSTRLFITIRQHELKYNWAEARELAFVIVKMHMYDVNNRTQPADSLMTTLMHVKQKDSTTKVFFEVDFKTPPLAAYILKVTIIDNSSNYSYEHSLYMQGNALQSNNSFLARINNEPTPSFDNFIDGKDSVWMSARSDHPKTVYVGYYATEFAPSSPPFQPGSAKRFSFTADRMMKFNMDELPYIILSGTGYYYFQYDTLIKKGFTLFRYGKNYPSITEIDQQMEAIRYLTNQQEYFEMKTGGNPGKRYQQFWADLAEKSETNPQLLLNVYFTRVMYANIFFTSYCEGFKTDRGMMYIIFGKPDEVTFGENSEIWTYTTSFDNLKLEFVKANNPYSENDFLLQRSEKLESPWNFALNSWRNGVVFGL